MRSPAVSAMNDPAEVLVVKSFRFSAFHCACAQVHFLKTNTLTCHSVRHGAPTSSGTVELHPQFETTSPGPVEQLSGTHANTQRPAVTGMLNSSSIPQINRQTDLRQAEHTDFKVKLIPSEPPKLY